MIYGAGALVVDVVVVALFACVVGVLCRKGRYLAGSGMGLVVLCGMALSIVGFYQFGVKERVAKTEIAQKQHAAILTADVQTNLRKDAVRARLLDDLQSEVENTSELLLAKQANINREVAKSEIAETRNKKAEIAFSDIEVKPAPVFIDPDPGAAGLAADTGFSVAAVQKSLTLALGSLLILAKALAFGFGFGMWPKSERNESPSTEITVSHSAPDNDLEGEEIFHRLEVVDPMTQVQEFYAEATRNAPAALPVTATELHAHYRHWASDKRYTPILAIQGFGRASVRLIESGMINVRRKVTSRGIEYVGRMPVIYENADAA